MFHNYSLEPEDDNEADQPKLTYNDVKKYIKLKLNANKLKKLHCTLKIALSQSLSANIFFECMIVPFNFFLEVYDPRKKAFVSNSIELFWAPKILHKLTFRVMSPCIPTKAFANFFFDLPNEMKLNKVVGLSGNGFKQSNENDFNSTKRTYSCVHEFSKNFIFTLFYDFNGNDFPKGTYEIRCDFSLKEKNFESKIEINKENRIKLKFIHYPVISINQETTKFNKTEGMDDIPIYVYNQDSADFDKYVKTMDLKKYYISSFCYLTPFQHCIVFLDETEIKYGEYPEKIQILSKDINPAFLKLDTNGNVCINSTNISPEINSKFEFDDNLKTQENKHSVSYTIIGEINSWFPAFSKYPHHHKYLEVIPENIESARANLLKEINPLLSPLRLESIDPDELLTHISKDSSFISNQNFAILMLILMDKKNIRKVGDLVNALPNDVISRGPKIRDYIPDESVDDDLLIIYSHNMIFYIEKIFKKRYEEIISYQGYLSLPIPKKVIDQCYIKAYNDFFNVPESQSFEITNPHSLAAVAIAEHEKSRKSKKISPLPNTKHHNECYILMEKSNPIPAKINDPIPKIRWNIQSNSESDDSSEEEEEEDINNLPEIKEPKEATSESLTQFFMLCSQAANLLPFHLSKKSDKKALDCFLILFGLYKQYCKGKKDFLAISKVINIFNDSFCTCVNRLKSGNVDFSFLPQSDLKIINSIKDDNSNLELIKIPEPDKVNLKRVPWKTKL